MRPSPHILTAMLVAAVLAGCGDETPTVPDQSSYRQTTPDTSSSTYSSNQGIYVDPYQNVATASSTATTSTDPLAGTGVKAQVTSSQTRGLFKKTLELTVTVQNQDAVEHSGYLVVTFLDSAGKSELAYRYVTLAPSGIQTLTVGSSNPAASGTVVFKERFL